MGHLVNIYLCFDSFVSVQYITMRAEEKDFDKVQFEKEVCGTSM